MAEEKSTKRLETIFWSFKLALKINPRMLFIWFGLSGILSALPAVSLFYYRSILDVLDKYISFQTGGIADVVPTIIVLGIILIFSGLSARINQALIYMMMYDSYYLGMQEYMMEKAQLLNLNELQKSENSSEYSWVIRRGGSLNDLLSGTCILFGKAISVITLLIVAFTISKVILIGTILYIIGVMIINVNFVDKLRVNWTQVKDNMRRAEYFEKVPQNPVTAKEIRIYENRDESVAQWEKAYKDVENYDKKHAFGVEIRTAVSSIGFYLFLIALLGYAIYEVATGKMTTALFLTIYTLSISISAAIGDITKGFLAVDYGLYALERQKIFFENAPRITEEEDRKRFDTPLDETKCFDVDHLTFCYREGQLVLDDVSFQVEKGETIALVGLNGSGKSTLIKILLGLYYPTSGSVKLYGRPYKAYKSDYISRKIGTFFQDFHTFHLSLRENVGMGDVRNIDNIELVNHALKMGGALKVADKLPNGIETRLERNVAKTGYILSGGEKQRVAVSRAHMSNKEILIFDEPASMIDPIAEVEQMNNIKDKLNGRTAILISHRIGFARLADRILVLQNGKLVETGSHEELLKNNGVYAAMFHEQAQWYNPKNQPTEEEGE